jgi:hypothetical protein
MDGRRLTQMGKRKFCGREIIRRIRVSWRSAQETG